MLLYDKYYKDIRSLNRKKYDQRKINYFINESKIKIK